MKELFEAVRAGDQAKVDQLVAADPTLAIFAASIQGDTEKLEKLLTANKGLISAVSDDGWRPLHLAAFFGKPDAVKLLLNKGADVAARSTNPMENTALHAAAAGQHSLVVAILLERGAKPNAQQAGGWAPMHAVAQSGDVETAKVLIAAGADVSQRAENQQRPLDLAVTKGQQAMVDFLEANGAHL